MVSLQRLKQSRVARNAAASYFAFVSTAACGLLSIPVAVAFLGKEQIGLWAVVNSILSYLMWMDLGIGSATGRKMADAISAKDQSEIDKWWTATRAALMLQGIILGIIGLAGIPLFLGLFNIGGSIRGQAVELIAGSVLLTALSMPLRGVPGLLTAQQRFHWIPLSQGFIPWLQLLVFFLLLRDGWGIRSYLFSMAAVQGCTWIYFLILIRTSEQVPRWNRQGLEKSRFRSLFGFSLNISFLAIIEAILTSLPTLLLSRFAGLSSVPLYTFTAKAAMLVTSLVRRTYHAFYPQMLRLHVDGNKEAFRQKHDIVGRLMLAIGLAAASAVLLFNRTIVELLAGADFYAGGMATAWMALGILVTPLSGLFESLVQFSGSMGKSSLVALTKLATGVVGAWLAYRGFGISGVAAVFALLPLIYATYGYFRGALRCGYQPGELSARVARMALMTGALFISVGWLASQSDSSPTHWNVLNRQLAIPDPTTAAAVAALIALASCIGWKAAKDLKAA
jgi:O-antigen/teichoic acid export membrane protein